MSRETIDASSTDWYRCSKCERSFFVRSKDEHQHLLKKSMRCPNFVRCKGRISRRSWNTADEIRNYQWVTALELFQASAGLGLKAERNCSPETLKRLMVGSKILSTEVQDTGDPQKSLLMSITLDNGKVIHTASSTKGAIVYKVTEVANGS